MVIARRYLALLLAALGASALLIMAMTGNATGPRLISHTFTYNGEQDGWAQSAELLAYSYGDRYSTLQQQASEGQSLPAQMHFSGAMPRAEFLYVKWRIKSTGEMFEQRVDLRDRLPADMLRHKVTFAIDGKQLHVFVATPQRLEGAPGMFYTHEVYPGS